MTEAPPFTRPAPDYRRNIIQAIVRHSAPAILTGKAIGANAPDSIPHHHCAHRRRVREPAPDRVRPALREMISEQIVSRAQRGAQRGGTVRCGTGTTKGAYLGTV